jgi:hypothetical protein
MQLSWIFLPGFQADGALRNGGFGVSDSPQGTRLHPNGLAKQYKTPTSGKSPVKRREYKVTNGLAMYFETDKPAGAGKTCSCFNCWYS